MEVEAFERFDHCIRRPADGLDVITQRSGKNLGPVIRINQIERRVIVCFRNVGKQRSQANPVRVIIDPGTSQGNGYFIGIGHCGRCKVRQTGTLCIVSKVGGETELPGQFIGSGGSECHVHPVVIERAGCNPDSFIGYGAQIIICETAYGISFCVIHSRILSFQMLPFQTCTIIYIPLGRNIPVVGGINS